MINLNNNEWHYDESNAKTVNKPWGREVWINFRKGERVGDEEKRYIITATRAVHYFGTQSIGQFCKAG